MRELFYLGTFFIFFSLGTASNAFCQEIDFPKRNLDNQIKTTIEGEVIGKKVDSLYLYQATTDPRGKKFAVPVKNGKFKYTLETDAIQAYKLVFPYQLHQGSWHSVVFFSEPGKIDLTLYPKTPVKDKAEGAKYTNTYQRLSSKLMSTYNPKFDSLYAQIDSLQVVPKSSNDSVRKADKIERLKNEIDSLAKSASNTQVQYIKNHRSPVSYYMMTEAALDPLADKQELEKQYQSYAQKYPNHPYTYLVRKSLGANDNIKTGSHYVNFTAPNIQGKNYELQSLIQGKIAILDLWASWCGPCIKTSRDLIPLYKKYKDKDFVVIGVAREFENTKRLKNALEKEQFPWLNLVDLDDKHHIWRQYGIPYSGGGQFLISSEGKILAIDPTISEINTILKKRL